MNFAIGLRDTRHFSVGLLINPPQVLRLPKSIIIERIESSPSFQEYRQAFQCATGLPLELVQAGELRFALCSKTHGENVFCQMLSVGGQECETCRQLNMGIAESMGERNGAFRDGVNLVHKNPGSISEAEQSIWDGTRTFECFAGMCETVVPVKGEGSVIGFLKTGQVLLRKPSRNAFREALSHIRELTDSFDSEELEKAYFRTPVVPSEKYEAITVLLKTYADQVSKQVHQLILETHHDAPLIVKRAKNYIHMQYSKPIRLEQVASEISVSPFHLSRVFKQSTGVGFLEYLNRTRIEHAKELLRKHELRVAEVAYMVGFQSLAPFNKAFRQFVGMVPKAFRKLNPI